MIFKGGCEVKLPAEKVLAPGGVSHATDPLEDWEVVADRIITFADIVSRETSLPERTAASAPCPSANRLGQARRPMRRRANETKSEKVRVVTIGGTPLRVRSVRRELVARRIRVGWKRLP